MTIRSVPSKTTYRYINLNIVLICVLHKPIGLSMPLYIRIYTTIICSASVYIMIFDLARGCVVDRLCKRALGTSYIGIYKLYIQYWLERAAFVHFCIFFLLHLIVRCYYRFPACTDLPAHAVRQEPVESALVLRRLRFRHRLLELW